MGCQSPEFRIQALRSGHSKWLSRCIASGISANVRSTVLAQTTILERPTISSRCETSQLITDFLEGTYRLSNSEAGVTGKDMREIRSALQKGVKQVVKMGSTPTLVRLQLNPAGKSQLFFCVSNQATYNHA